MECLLGQLCWCGTVRISVLHKAYYSLNGHKNITTRIQVSHKQSLYYTYCISLLIFSSSSKQLTILGLAVRMAAACSGLLRTRFCTLMSNL